MTCSSFDTDTPLPQDTHTPKNSGKVFPTLVAGSVFVAPPLLQQNCLRMICIREE